MIPKVRGSPQSFPFAYEDVEGVTDNKYLKVKGHVSTILERGSAPILDTPPLFWPVFRKVFLGLGKYLYFLG